MKTEIIVKRECGARIKIQHELHSDWFKTSSNVSVSVALKGKRKFIHIPSEKNHHTYLSREQREIIDLNLYEISEEEIIQVKEKTLEEIRKQIM